MQIGSFFIYFLFYIGSVPAVIMDVGMIKDGEFVKIWLEHVKLLQSKMKRNHIQIVKIKLLIQPSLSCVYYKLMKK